MDLGTVRKRLKEFAYSHPEQFISDTRLVFRFEMTMNSLCKPSLLHIGTHLIRNAYLYNPPHTPVWVEAEHLSKMFEERIAKERLVQI